MKKYRQYKELKKNFREFFWDVVFDTKNIEESFYNFTGKKLTQRGIDMVENFKYNYKTLEYNFGYCEANKRLEYGGYKKCIDFLIRENEN